MKHFISRNSSLVVKGRDAVAQIFGSNGELLLQQDNGDPKKHDKDCELLGAPVVEMVSDAIFKGELEKVGMPSLLFLEKRRSITLTNFSPSFEWRGDSRWLPNPFKATGRDVLSSCQLPLLATFLAAKMWNVRSSADYVTYLEASKAAGRDGVMSYFQDSSYLQRWCAKEGIVDLTAIVVNKSIRQPGGGAYVCDYRNVEEWELYMAEFRDSLRDWV